MAVWGLVDRCLGPDRCLRPSNRREPPAVEKSQTVNAILAQLNQCQCIYSDLERAPYSVLVIAVPSQKL